MKVLCYTVAKSCFLSYKMTKIKNNQANQTQKPPNENKFWTDFFYILFHMNLQT